MKKLLLACLLLSSFNSIAGIRVTKRGYPACLTKSAYNSFTKALSQRDANTVYSFIKSGRCVMLKPGLQAYVVDYSLFSATTVRINGVRLFMSGEGLK